MGITMSDILNCNTGSKGGSIDVSYRKVVNTAQFETETIEASMHIELEGNESSRAVALKQAVAQARLEYVCIVSLLTKGYIKQEDFNERIQQIEAAIQLLSGKMERIGKDGDLFISFDGGITGESTVDISTVGENKVIGVLEQANNVANIIEQKKQSVQQPVAQQTVQQPVQQPVAKQPVQQPVEQPVVQQPVAKQHVQQPVEQPVVQQPVQQPVAKQHVQQPVAQQPVQQPVQQTTKNAAEQHVQYKPMTVEEYYASVNKKKEDGEKNGVDMSELGVPMKLELGNYPGAEDVTVENKGDVMSLAKKMGARIGGKR